MAPPSPRGRPFPWKHAMILAWCQFTSAFSFAVLFPFVPFMIVDLGLVADSRSSGLYSGFLISASQLGKILTAYCWGSWSDRHGRKRVMYVGLAGISVAMLGFGLAGSFELACLARFLGGASDNIFGAAKTLLSESMEEEHQAKGMALLGSAWGFAIIFGPAVGGLLSRPALKYPAVFDPAGVFGVYPYLLPCCFTTGMAMVAMVLLQAVPETVGERAGALEPAEGAAPEEERETLLAEEDAGDASEAQPVDGADGADGGAAGGLALGEDGSGKIQRHWLLQRKPFLAVVTCGVMNCFVIADDDVMPLWAAAPRATGGLGLTTNQIGLMLGVIGVLLLACFTCFAPLDKAFGTLRAFQAALLVFIPGVALTPIAGDFESEQAMWAWVFGMGAVKAVAMEYVIIGMGMLINNSVGGKQRGAVNGAAETVGAFGRLLAPALASPLFAWSLTGGAELGWPFNHHLVFWVNAGLGLLVLVLACVMPASIGKPPVEGGA